MTNSNYSSSIHECAHAAAALSHGNRVRFVTIIPAGKTNGRCFYSPGATPMTTAVICLAGPLGEERLTRKPYEWGYDSSNEDSDFRTILAASETHYGRFIPFGSQNDFLMQAKKQATEIVNRNWSGIESAAARLRKETMLAGKEIAKILNIGCHLYDVSEPAPAHLGNGNTSAIVGGKRPAWQLDHELFVDEILSFIGQDDSAYNYFANQMDNHEAWCAANCPDDGKGDPEIWNRQVYLSTGLYGATPTLVYTPPHSVE